MHRKNEWKQGVWLINSYSVWLKKTQFSLILISKIEPIFMRNAMSPVIRWCFVSEYSKNKNPLPKNVQDLQRILYSNSFLRWSHLGGNYLLIQAINMISDIMWSVKRIQFFWKASHPPALYLRYAVTTNAEDRLNARSRHNTKRMRFPFQFCKPELVFKRVSSRAGGRQLAWSWWSVHLED